MKRFLDVIVSALALILAVPVIFAVGLLIYIRMGSPIFFCQTRPGLHARPFKMIKFRTMLETFGPDGTSLPDQARLTGLGQMLRRTSLDELPELWNVLKGEMSLVGPRPLLMEYVPLYSPDQSRRHEVRLGISGWAQVNGRNAISWDEKLGLDVWYVDNRNTLLDLKILFLTVLRVIARHGISAEGEATMPKFRGNRP